MTQRERNSKIIRELIEQNGFGELISEAIRRGTLEHITDVPGSSNITEELTRAQVNPENYLFTVVVKRKHYEATVPVNLFGVYGLRKPKKD